MLNWDKNDDLLIAYSRNLALDIFEGAKSGHPGTTLSLTPLYYLLYSRILKHNPENPEWENRDHLITSCGHAVLAQYIQLYLSGYKITMNDLENFRKLGSITPGHPERSTTPGIEISTGPLGQGFAGAIGIALSKQITFKFQESKIKSESFTYVVVSDGDMQEGITYEAAHLATDYKLEKLIAIYDSNGITIDGDVAGRAIRNTGKIYEAIGWNVVVVDKLSSGEMDLRSLFQSIKICQKSPGPHLIVLNTEIGWPSPTFKNSAFIHGNMLPSDEVTKIKKLLETQEEPKFVIPDHLLNYYRGKVSGRKLPNNKSASGTKNISKLAEKITDLKFPEFISTRKANGIIIENIKAIHRKTIGGSADLTESNSLTLHNLYNGDLKISKENIGANLQYGVREHAMSAISNGLAIDNSNIVYCATYLVFADYQKPALRMSALMSLPIVYVWTHDSIAIGSDGPTHQPVEQLAMLRAIPNFAVLRPGSSSELQYIWTKILNTTSPVGLILSRQDLANPSEKHTVSKNALKGGYTFHENSPNDLPDIIIIATGSELSIAYAAAKATNVNHIRIRVVSMPSQEWFLGQNLEYRESVLPKRVKKRIVIEAASSFGWHRFAENGKLITVDDFGKSGSGTELQKLFGFTVDNLVSEILEMYMQKSNFDDH